MSQCQAQGTAQNNRSERGTSGLKVWGADDRGCRAGKGALSGDTGGRNCIHLHAPFQTHIFGHFGVGLLTLQAQARDVLLPLSADQGRFRIEATRPVGEPGTHSPEGVKKQMRSSHFSNTYFWTFTIAIVVVHSPSHI